MNTIIFQILFVIYNCNIIVLPFRSTNDAKNIYDNCFMKELYTEVSIGSPPQNLNININQDNFIFYISPDICYEHSPSYYNYSNSKSFYLISPGPEEDGFYELGGGTYARDSFSFFNSTDLKSNITNIKLDFFYSSYLSYQKYHQICGVLGLGLKKRKANNDFEVFLSILKKKKIINNYLWTYLFFNKDKEFDAKKILNMPLINNEYIIKNFDGLIIIGNYSEINDNNILTTLAVERDNELKWDIIINKIYNKYEQITNSEKKIYLYLSINYDYIIAPKDDFDKIILPYFNDFIENKKCKLNEIKKDLFSYEIITCDKKLFDEKDIKTFPTIYFSHQDFNYTFELTYNDLFEIKNNEIYFLIIKNKNNFSQNIWRMGKIFLKKYHFSFNQDSKTINFHQNKIIKIGNIDNKGNINNNDNKNKNKSKFNINYIWIIICLICLIIGIYLGNKWIIKRRKLRANELQDDFEYRTNIENNDKNNVLLNEKNIEMGIKGLGI